MTYALYLSNDVNKKKLIDSIMSNELLAEHIDLSKLKGLLHSSITIDKIIDDEFRHDRFPVTTKENASMESMSSGQQKKALLNYLIEQKPDYLVLDDVYSNVDKATQQEIKNKLCEIESEIMLIQLSYRRADILPQTTQVFSIGNKNELKEVQDYSAFVQSHETTQTGRANFELPRGYNNDTCLADPLIELKDITVSYGEKKVLNKLNWTLHKGEFWQLSGPNGSGKSTLVTLISGDNPRAYGQNLWLFGIKKGSGETIWDIRKHIGYFTPNMTTRFTRDESVANMIISGLNDSVGLYVQPTELQKKIAQEWVNMLGPAFKNKSFQNLSIGQQRMVMVARAMVKKPPLLILDEPTIELDEENSSLFIELVNAIAREKQTTIIYVSHRDEQGLKPTHLITLTPSAGGGYTGLCEQCEQTE